MARPLHLINEFHKGDLLSARVVGLDAALAALTTGITDAEEYADDLIEVEITRANAAYDAAGAAAAAQAASQPLDSDLTAIAALATTSFGRALLALADAAAGRTAFGLGTAATHATGDYDAAGAASTALTTAETYTDTSIASEVTRANAAYQPVDSDLTAIAALATTSVGRSLLAGADAAALRTILALGTAATHATGDYDAAGAASSALTTAEAYTDTAVAAVTTTSIGAQPVDSDLTAIAALSTTSFGRTFLDLADAAAARTKLGLGTAALSATGDFDAAGLAAAAQAASQPLDSDLTAFAGLAIAADKLPYGSGSHALSLADFTAAGRALIDDADAAAQRTTLGLGALALLATLAHSATTGQTATDHHPAPAAGPDGDVTIDTAGAAGTAATFARSGHGHKVSTSASAAAAIGTAAAGTSGHSPSRDDHVHATGAGVPTTSAFGDAAATGTGPAASMTDHVHGREALGTTPSTQAFGDAAAGGTATTASKNDHKHAMMAAPAAQRAAASAAPAAVGTAAVGTGTTDARDDHVHATGAGTPSTSAFGDAAATGAGPAAAMTNHVHGRESLGTTPTTSAFSDAAAGGSAVTASKNDHVHGREALGTTPSTQAFSDAAAGGSAVTASKNDHKHAMMAVPAHSATTGITATDHHAAPVAGPDGALTIGGAGAAGTAGAFARSGHSHAMPTGQTVANAGSASAMPGSPSTNDLCFRTDLGLEFYYDGTRWLSTCLFTHLIRGAGNAGLIALAATESAVIDAGTPTSPGTDIYLVNLVTQFFVVGGTALSGTQKWVQTLNKVPTGNGDTLLATVTIASGSLSAWRTDTTALNALMNNGTVHFAFRHAWTKTGTPGNLYWSQWITYRIVST